MRITTLVLLIASALLLTACNGTSTLPNLSSTTPEKPSTPPTSMIAENPTVFTQTIIPMPSLSPSSPTLPTSSPVPSSQIIPSTALLKSPGFDIDVSTLKESTTDLLGLSATSRNYRPMMEAGAKIVNLDSAGTFFLVWLPEGYSKEVSKRVMVAIHGSDGTAYAESQDELTNAQKYKYAIIGIQWWLGRPESYLNPSQVYEIIDLALRYIDFKYGADLHKVCYEGFSRGSAVSYEVTYWDRQCKTNYFAMTVSHSGGIPPDQPTPFFKSLTSGKYGYSPFVGTHFFMYSGMKDEEWGTRQCDYMRYTRDTIEKYGAHIVKFIEDPEGGHRGYHLNNAYHEAAIKLFIELTP
jgi:hypothetical protein